MVSKEFFKALEQVAEERDIPKEKILDIFGKGLLNAYKKDYNGQQNAKVVFNEEKAEIIIVATYLVVEEVDPEAEKGTQITVMEAQQLKKNAKAGDIIEVKVTPKDFGRIAVSSAKQILTQGLKQLERERNFEIFTDKTGEMVIAEIVAVNDEFVTLYLGFDTETSIPARDLVGTEIFVGNQIRVYITKVEQTTKGPKVYVSRTDRNLVKRLMEQSIPELQEGVIEIMGLARDPGDRCKVCVASNNLRVDPVGACLGRNGARIHEVIDALDGEKIDVYKYSEDPAELVSNAIQPAKTTSVIVDQREKSAVIIVPDDQLSLAIGKKGQNARLAVQSSGWKIDIKSETDAMIQGIKY
ncbi:MAG TPA: transcription termination factor NusA [Bacillota bacterium]|nr:transcription termination factor NusA [Bacillota bacterium]HPF42465.1 transcription termination factor NusA [Bacillota bacterium]HPJ85768.1 transcription termination factor NusA [Bacillota bacterium]HPQ61595.1 transcription termination factor NusA [Bacillota bacterium]HRX91492.1 transcription termination factor NusA [Candidatus Izemoplasmatales bacterium]